MEEREETARLAVLSASREVDIAGVVRVLREHVALAGVANYGLEELRDLIPDPGAGTPSAAVTAAMQCGALEVAALALQEHSARADVQISAGAVLSSLAQVFPSEVVASGAIEAAVAGMRAHVADFDVQAQACQLLSCLSAVVKFGDARAQASKVTARVNARRAGEAGAVAAVLTALRTHGSKLHEHGTRALLDLVHARENALRALRADALDVCVAILHATLPLAPTKVLCCLDTVTALNRIIDENKHVAAARAGELGAVEVAVRLLGRYAQEAELQFFGCGLLCLLMAHHAPNVGRAWRAGALQRVQAAMNVQGQWHDETQVLAVVIIPLLQKFLADAEAAADAAAAELLADEAAAGSQAAGQPAGKSKKKRNKPKKAAADAGGKPPPAQQQTGGASSAAAGAASEELQRPTCVICLEAQPCVVLPKLRLVALIPRHGAEFEEMLVFTDEDTAMRYWRSIPNRDCVSYVPMFEDMYRLVTGGSCLIHLSRLVNKLHDRVRCVVVLTLVLTRERSALGEQKGVVHAEKDERRDDVEAVLIKDKKSTVGFACSSTSKSATYEKLKSYSRVILPCRHLPVCAAAACAAMMRGLCPICRAPVTDTLAVYQL
jgi:hypothetical protein